MPIIAYQCKCGWITHHPLRWYPACGGELKQVVTNDFYGQRKGYRDRTGWTWPKSKYNPRTGEPWPPKRKK